MTEAQRLNLRSAQRLALNAIGMPDVSVDSNQLSYTDRSEFIKELSKIVLQYPERFAPETLAMAQQAGATNYQPLGTYGAGDAFTEFIDEAAEQAREINPLDSRNIGSVGKNLLIAAVIIGVVWVLVNQRPSGPTPAPAV